MEGFWKEAEAGESRLWGYTVREALPERRRGREEEEGGEGKRKGRGGEGGEREGESKGERERRGEEKERERDPGDPVWIYDILTGCKHKTLNLYHDF